MVGGGAAGKKDGRREEDGGDGRRDGDGSAVEINSVRNAKLIKKKSSFQTKFIWVIRPDKQSGRV